MMWDGYRTVEDGFGWFRVVEMWRHVEAPFEFLSQTQFGSFR